MTTKTRWILLALPLCGALIGAVCGILSPKHELWAFDVLMPIIPKISYQEDRKIWKPTTLLSPFEFASIIKNQFSKTQTSQDPYVSKVYWNAVHRDAYLQITVRAPQQEAAKTLIEKIIAYMNEKYDGESQRAFDRHKKALEKHTLFRDQLEKRIRALGGTEGSSPLAGAVAELLASRLDELNGKIEFETEAISVEGSPVFRLLGPEEGVYSGRYPNLLLLIFVGLVLGFCCDLLYIIFTSRKNSEGGLAQ
ncbi:MAG: hypothetical protein AB7F59_10375 [Bdellovibrionales bacterium]